MFTTSTDTDKIAPAMAKALALMKQPPKTQTNSHFGNKYADLAGVIEAGKKTLADQGLIAFQALGVMENGLLPITTRVMHESGQWFESVMHMPTGKGDAQAVGSAATYGRRYSLMAMLGMAGEDDDGEAASKDAPVAQSNAVSDLIADLNECPGDKLTLRQWKKENMPEIDRLPEGQRLIVVRAWNTRWDRAKAESEPHNPETGEA